MNGHGRFLFLKISSGGDAREPRGGGGTPPAQQRGRALPLTVLQPESDDLDVPGWQSGRLLAKPCNPNPSPSGPPGGDFPSPRPLFIRGENPLCWPKDRGKFHGAQH